VEKPKHTNGFLWWTLASFRPRSCLQTIYFERMTIIDAVDRKTTAATVARRWFVF